MLLFDEETMDCYPEDLPRRVLQNFSIYNAEVRVVGAGKIEGLRGQEVKGQRGNKNHWCERLGR